MDVTTVFRRLPTQIPHIIEPSIFAPVQYKSDPSYPMGDHVVAPEQDRPKVIIVGAGVGGVATAARLAAAGCQVTVVEKNEFSGGRCSLIHRKGYVRTSGSCFYASTLVAI